VSLDPTAQLSPKPDAIAPNESLADVDPEAVDAAESMVFAGSDFMSISAALECLLFVADRPVDAQQLARALRLQLQTVQAGLQVLADELAVQERGIRLQMQGDKVRLVTRPDARRHEALPLPRPRPPAG
jgi:segregation and condensation protein B